MTAWLSGPTRVILIGAETAAVCAVVAFTPPLFGSRSDKATGVWALAIVSGATVLVGVILLMAARRKARRDSAP